ncbi:MAG TPA: mercury methylation ferredoxin HgcB [Chroococcales cyanobacterium]
MELRYLKEVTTLLLNPELCVGCGMCLEVCPHGVLACEGKASILEADRCMECGACARNCPAKAITVKAGVGCAAAFIKGALTGSEPTCGCSEKNSGCC